VRVPSRIGVVVLVAAGVIALPAAAGALTQAPAAASANTQTFTDSTGETPGAPDITTIVVSNTDAGMITFRVNVPNRPQLGQDMLLDLFVNTDNNTTTGSQDIPGIDYVIELARGEINLYKWDGTNFTRRFGDPPAVTLRFTYNGGFTVSISAAELGNTKRFAFYLEVLSGIAVDPVTGDLDFTNAVGDAAPGGGAGFYPFTVITAKPTLQVKKVTATPRAPTAGKRFTLRMTAARSDTGATLRSGRVTCVGRVGRAPLRARVARVVAGAVTCTWVIPKNAKGKSFRGSAAVVFEGLKATRSLSARIR
jgi:hypothetical protein